ncbi:MAG: hypothetical protein E7233_10720 [Lachnospiraceae bacterium]|nr:hypothetical protein [Lachnospiraceae bacterium]
MMENNYRKGPWGDEERGGYGRGREGNFKGGPQGKGGRGGPGDLLRGKLQGKTNAQIMFVGSVNCLRHKPYLGIGELMKEGKASILCPSMSDFSSGRYLNQIEEAIVELSQERGCKDFIIICGCQWVILSTDGDLICERLKNDHDINVTISVDDHLEFGDHE